MGVDHRAFAHRFDAGGESRARREGQARAVKVRAVLIAKNRGVPVVRAGGVVARLRQVDSRIRSDGEEAHLILAAAAELRHRVGGEIDRGVSLGADADRAVALQHDGPAQGGRRLAAALSVNPHRRVEAAVQGIGAAGDVDRPAREGAGALAVAGDDFDAGAAVAVKIDSAVVAHQPAAAGIDRQQAHAFRRAKLRAAVEIDGAVVKRDRFRPVLDAHGGSVLHPAAEHDAPVVNRGRVKLLRNGADAAALVYRHLLHDVAFRILRRAADVDLAARGINKAGAAGVEQDARAAVAAARLRYAEVNRTVVDPLGVA